jgi:hypothetical protein
MISVVFPDRGKPITATLYALGILKSRKNAQIAEAKITDTIHRAIAGEPCKRF